MLVTFLNWGTRAWWLHSHQVVLWLKRYREHNVDSKIPVYSVESVSGPCSIHRSPSQICSSQRFIPVFHFQLSIWWLFFLFLQALLPRAIVQCSFPLKLCPQLHQGNGVHPYHQPTAFRTVPFGRTTQALLSRSLFKPKYTGHSICL